MKNDLKNKKLLTYFVSFNGEKFYNKTSKCIETLIKKGEYSGDIIILTDIDNFKIDINEKDYKKIKFINCKNIVVKNIEYTKNIHDIKYYRNIKGYISKLIDLYQYDAILYLDSDVLTNKNVDIIFDKVITENKILIQKDVANVDKNKPVGTTTGGLVLNNEQIEYLHGNGFCTGVLCIPKMYFEIFKLWHEKNIIENMQKSDQGNFHWVIAELKLLKYIEYVPANPFGNLTEEQFDKKVFLHYWTEENKKFQSRYELIINSLNIPKNEYLIQSSEVIKENINNFNYKDYKLLNAKYYIINTKNDTKRSLHFINEINKKEIPFEQIKCIIQEKSLYKNLSVIQSNIKYTHLQILKNNLNCKSNIIICEDDIIFCNNFENLIKIYNKEFLKIPDDNWDVVFFYHSIKNDKFENTEIIKYGRTDGTYFYLINKNSIKKIYNLLLDFCESKQIDWAYRQLFTDKKINSFIFKNDLISK